MTQLERSSKLEVTIGSSVLGLVTLGIYDDPLVVYREYVQNAVDALVGAGQLETGKIVISLDQKQRQLRVQDNGPGLTYQQCIHNLIPVGRSEKVVGRDRGFRGIGRLSALAFAGSVAFLTRPRGCKLATRVVWSGVDRIDWTKTAAVTEETVRNCVSVETLDVAGYPDSFFEVQVDSVNRRSGGKLLNRDAVRRYVSEVCPVPMGDAFPFAEDLERLFGPVGVPHVQQIVVGDDSKPLQRQYGTGIRFSEERLDPFKEFQAIRVPSLDGPGAAAVGWIVHSSYLGAIPKSCGIRGVRARLGNIQVGGETVFDHLFPEERFNRWCVGEVHILDSRIVPNAQRNYFEPNPHLRNLENHLIPYLNQIASRCRSASSGRNAERKLLSILSRIEDMYELATSGYLAASDSSELVASSLAEVLALRERFEAVSPSPVDSERLDTLEAKLRGFEPDSVANVYGDMSTTEIDIYQKVFRHMAKVSPARYVQEAIESAMNTD